MSEAQEALYGRRGKAVTTWVGWLELNDPDAVTLEEYRRLRAEGDAEARMITPRAARRVGG